MNKGFTLIELLVVVLIIGILAAIAVPQYNKITEQARTREAYAVLKSLKDAQTRYYTTHGQNTTLLEELDLTIPVTKYWRYAMYVGISIAAIRSPAPISGKQYLIAYRFDSRSDTPQIICRAEPSSDTVYGEKICKGYLGAKRDSGGGWWVLEER